MKKMDIKAFTLIILVIVIGALFYYVYLGNHSARQKESSNQTEAEKLLNYDFENDYPKTVRETVKLHNTYLKYAYNGTFTEEELETVNKDIRQLFDDELLQYNSEEDQLSGLKEEIQSYNDDEKKFVNFSVAEGSQVQYNTDNGRNYAKIRVSLVIKVKGASAYPEEDYILRQDENGNWKILGWQAVATEEATTQEKE